MSLSTQFLDELRARTSLSTLIGRTVKLTKAGREMKGCCPFHNEKTASFYVNDDKGFYHCFGCSAHGDAIRFLTESRGMQFMDAVKDLAGAAGLAVPANDPRQAERDREFEEAHAIMERAARWFVSRFDGINDKQAANYLVERSIPPSIVRDFGIGFAPGARNADRLSQHLVDIPLDKLMSLGLVKSRVSDGEIWDTFRRRLIFPIHDGRGRVIGFGGRILGEGEPKYLNSPDTILFDKGRTLFNLHRAAPAARKSGRLIVVEGYMDVIAMARADIPETVAPNGTALTEAQIGIAWNLVDVPIVCMDGDKAGQAAMARASIRALPMLEPGKSLAFVTPPAGQDPDDLLRAGGKDAVHALFAKPRPLVDVLWAHERDAAPCETPEQIAGLRKRLRAHVSSIRSADVRAAYGNEMAKRWAATFDITAERQGTAAPQIRSSHHTTERQPFSRKPSPSSPAQRQISHNGMGRDIEHAILLGLALYPDVTANMLESVSMMNCRIPEFRQVRDEMVNALIERAPPERLLAMLVEREVNLTARVSFSFTRTDGYLDGARKDLEQAILSLCS